MDKKEFDKELMKLLEKFYGTEVLHKINRVYIEISTPQIIEMKAEL